MFVNRITSERVNVGSWMIKLGVGALYRNFGRLRVIAPGVRTPKNVAFDYDVGKISADCLVLTLKLTYS